jgi:hypothetical protein
MAYPGGWLSLEGMNPIPITNFISVARLFDGAGTPGDKNRFNCQI